MRNKNKQKRWTRCLVRGFYKLEPEYYYQQASVPTIAAIVLATNHVLLDKIVSYLNSKDTLNLIRALGTEQVYLERLLKLRQNQSKISPWSRDGLSEDRYEKVHNLQWMGFEGRDISEKQKVS